MFPWMLLLACGPVGEPESPEPTAPAVETSCADGVDNDRNGLLDCEDDACDGVGSCVELGCDDGADNEGDGAIDCFDDDCWGEGNCRPVLSRSGGTATVDARRDRTINRCYGTSFGTILTGSFSSANASTSVQLRDVHGEVRLGDTGPSCPFSLYGVSWGQRSVSGEIVARPARRSRFALAYGCPFGFDSATMPETLQLNSPWDPAMWTITAGDQPIYGVTPGAWEVTPEETSGAFGACRWTEDREAGHGSAELTP